MRARSADKFTAISLVLMFSFCGYAQDAAPAAVEDYAPSFSLWEGISRVGPIFVALHGLMLIGFAAAILFSIRNPRSVSTFAWCISPFVFGALAVWIGIFGLSAAATVGGYYFSPQIPEELALLRRPFLMGSGLTFITFTAQFLMRLARKDRTT
jgi:hypothetical protein